MVLAVFRFTFGRPKVNPGVRGWVSPGDTHGARGRAAPVHKHRVRAGQAREVERTADGPLRDAAPPKKAKFPLAKGEKLCYGVCITIEVAEAKSPGEPAGREPGGGKSAEFRRRARQRDGDGENISATVRGKTPAVALSAYDAIAVQSR